jgi:hypothetical protein
MRRLDQGVVFAGASGSAERSATFPLPWVTPGGRWGCAFRAAPRKQGHHGQRVLLTHSDDQGRTWSAPREPFPPMEIDGVPGRMRVAGLTALDERNLLAVLTWVDFSDPDAPYFNETTEGLLDTRILISESGDAGETWAPPRAIDTAPFPPPTPITGPLLVLPNGELACQFELNKPYHDPSPWRHASVMLFSADGGRTWPRHTIAAQDPENRVFFWDQRPSVLGEERLLDLFWTFDRETAAYRNIHARESRDGGRTWSGLWDTGVPGQPGPAFTLADGALAMPYVDRTAAPAIKVRRSTDGGRSWGAGELTLYAPDAATQSTAKSSMQDAWAEMYAFSVGLPNAAALPGGGALVVYYAGERTDATAIRWAVVG